MAGLFQILRGNADGTFQRAEALKGTDGQPLIIPTEGEDKETERICTRPFAVDWDGDSRLDLVVGNFAGGFYWFKGEGSGKFLPKAEAIKSGANQLRIEGYHGDPFVIDWDGDGDLDLLSGSNNGGVQWAENCAGKGKPPELLKFQTLIEPRTSVLYGLPESDLNGPTASTRIWVDDFNGDGKLDILIGDRVTIVSPANGVIPAVFQKRFAALQDAFAAASSDPGLPRSAERIKSIQDFDKLYQKRSEFMNEDHTGFIWLYQRK